MFTLNFNSWGGGGFLRVQGQHRLQILSNSNYRLHDTESSCMSIKMMMTRRKKDFLSKGDF